MNKKYLIPFIDCLVFLVIIFITISSLLKFASKQSEEALQQQSIYQIVLMWDGKLKSDMDLWAKDPVGRIVGFNRREGGDASLFSLNRDDLGMRTEQQNGKTIEVNEEIISIRGTFNGEYIVNGHLYHRQDESPVIATAKLVKVKPFKEIIKKERSFSESGDEQTFFRFKIEDGNVIETNELPTKVANLNTDGPSESTENTSGQEEK